MDGESKNKMEKYIKNGKYNASNNDFIYYENGNNCFCASISFGNKKIEVYQGNKNGGADYYDLPLKSQEELLKICGRSSYNTRQLMKYVRENDLNKKEETKNGLGVKLNLVGKDGNAFALLSLFRRTALKQGFTNEQIEPVLKEAQRSEYYHLLSTLMNNCN